MDLTAFETYVTSLANVGTALSPALLREEVRNAGKWMEMNYSFLYMEAFRAFTQAIGDRYIALSARPKRIELLREVQSDGRYRHYDQVDARDYDESDFAGLGSPSVFWLDGQGTVTPPQSPRLVLNLAPTSPLDLEMIEIRLSDWDGMAPAAGHWLFDYGRQALASQVLWQLYTSPILRDPEMAQTMVMLRQQGIDTTLNLDDELRRSLRSEEMRYGRGV